MLFKNNVFKFSFLLLLALGTFITGCGDDDVPGEENEVEVITDVTLVFTNTADPSDVVTATAQDPDGEGVEELQIIDEINLATSTSYTLSLEIFNNLESPGEDIGEEIAEEDEEHQLFYAFSNDAFATPAGDGNIDNSSDAVIYDDSDANGNPVGLSTSWTTGSTAVSGGSFTVRLQHQPDIKSSTTGADDGDTDFELSFVLNIQ